MTHATPWARRLSSLATLTAEELQFLDQLGGVSRKISPHEALVKVGDPAENMLVVVDGLACEFRLLPDGRRQILSYLLAGDMTDPRQLLLPRWDHSICVLSPTRVATINASDVQKLQAHPNIARALGRYSIMKQAIAREWLVNVGNRTAFERVGHLLCEIHARLSAVGLTTRHAFELPMTQAELADTLALSAVHVNRTLMELRRLKLVTFQTRQAAIHDLPGLRAVSGFDPAYLQVPQEGNAS